MSPSQANWNLTDAIISIGQGSNDAAWSWLMEQLQDELTSLGQAILGNASAALDAVQDFALQLPRAARSFRRRSPDQQVAERQALAWLRLVFINICRSHLRRQLKQAQVSMVAPVLASSDSKQWLVDLQGDLQGAMASLSPAQQAAIIGHHMDGLSYAELAERMGTTALALRHHASRGMKKLRAKLGRHWRYVPLAMLLAVMRSTAFAAVQSSAVKEDMTWRARARTALVVALSLIACAVYFFPEASQVQEPAQAASVEALDAITGSEKATVHVSQDTVNVRFVDNGAYFIFGPSYQGDPAASGDHVSMIKEHGKALLPSITFVCDQADVNTSLNTTNFEPAFAALSPKLAQALARQVYGVGDARSLNSLQEDWFVIERAPVFGGPDSSFPEEPTYEAQRSNPLVPERICLMVAKRKDLLAMLETDATRMTYAYVIGSVVKGLGTWDAAAVRSIHGVLNGSQLVVQ